ncbi:hypothetical protein KUTeg_022027 [Tegillarca granosa]|uniref:Zinc finger PHD-type domain-containing protein n=1 Tax=Tegillarca granosa TaxID=220873 RepID=A0ABQ9EB72_TEGGR|nr:hypothetical protein KUTeg_022027 [Tegillarca granosa]
MLMWALSFAALNRIGLRDLESNITRKAQDMALFHFLPNQDDYNNLKVRMEVMVLRILKEYFNAFKEVDVVDHIPHDYSEDSCKKTKILFNPLVDLLGFTTDGFTALLAMKLCGIDKLSELPSDFPTTSDAKEEYLLDLAKKLVTFIWRQVDMKEIKNVIDAPDEDDDKETFYEFCVCKNGDYMVKCSSSLCNRGTWFHITCIGLDQKEVPDDDWWCSDVCQAQKDHNIAYATCIIHHYRQLNAAEEIMYRWKGSKWKCAACRSDIKTDGDHVFLYTCALLYKGLQDRAYKDAVRENDSEIMISHWRMDMIQFWQNHHNKYLILGHKLLAGV